MLDDDDDDGAVAMAASLSRRTAVTMAAGAAGAAEVVVAAPDTWGGDIDVDDVVAARLARAANLSLLGGVEGRTCCPGGSPEGTESCGPSPAPPLAADDALCAARAANLSLLGATGCGC